MKSISKKLWMVSQKTNGAHTDLETHAFTDREKRFGENVLQKSQHVWQKSRRASHIIQSEHFQHEWICWSLTLRVLSTSPQGNRFTKSMPVRGVPVGGSKMDASIIRYSTFRGLFYTHSAQKQRKNAKTFITPSLFILVHQTQRFILLDKHLLDICCCFSVNITVKFHNIINPTAMILLLILMSYPTQITFFFL